MRALPMQHAAITCLGFLLALALGVSAAGAEGRDALEKAVEATPPDAPPPAEAGDPPTVFAASEMDWSQTDVGSRTQLMDAATRTLRQLEIHITTLAPGRSSHAPHRHPNEEVIVLREGELEVYVNGQTRRVGAGSVLVFLSGDWHSVENVGEVQATYEVINFHP